MRNLQTVKCGNVERKTFAEIKEIQEIPYLVEVQKNSYEAFIEEGIGEVLEDFSPITDFGDHYELYFLDHNLNGMPKYTEKECRDRDATYAVPLEVKVRLVNKVTGEIIDLGVETGVIKKAGSWFSYNETKLGQGRDALKRLLDENPELCEELYAKIMDALNNSDQD